VSDPHPPCPICLRAVERREGETQYNHTARRYCRRACEREGRSLSAVSSHPARVFPTGWPAITDPEQASMPADAFAAYELRLRPQPGRMDRPPTVLPGGSALGGDS
jgi:hypothetical protein